MNAEIKKILKTLIGKKPSYVRVGNFRSLSIGFGRMIKSKDDRKKFDYAEWDVGSYRSFWRILDGNRILFLKDAEHDVNSLNEAVNGIEFGNLLGFEMLTPIDVRLKFDSGVQIDFIAAIQDEDEYFHVFCPENKYIELAPGGIWTIGKSNMSW